MGTHKWFDHVMIKGEQTMIKRILNKDAKSWGKDKKKKI